MKFVICFIILFQLPVSIMRAQDLTGVWEGSGGNMVPYAKLVIVKHGNSYIGYTYDEGSGHCKANFAGKFDSSKQKLKGKGAGMIEATFLHVQFSFNLNYSKKGKDEFLDGPSWPKSVALKMLSLGIPYFMHYKKTNSIVDSSEFTAKMKTKLVVPDTLMIADAQDSLVTQYDTEELKLVELKQSRRSDTIQLITTNERKINFSIFDNGVVDGDSVSIFYNNKMIANRIAVIAKAFEFEITLENNNVMHEVTLVAHNLGSIPPNTALLVIKAGANNYRLYASSDYTKNGLVVIQYKE